MDEGNDPELYTAYISLVKYDGEVVWVGYTTKFRSDIITRHIAEYNSWTKQSSGSDAKPAMYSYFHELKKRVGGDKWKRTKRSRSCTTFADKFAPLEFEHLLQGSKKKSEIKALVNEYQEQSDLWGRGYRRA
tara:strand:- start:3494 stop:3889 length:396 start_codon:yes stop_codon:yes gene_type:complete